MYTGVISLSGNKYKSVSIQNEPPAKVCWINALATYLNSITWPQSS